MGKQASRIDKVVREVIICLLFVIGIGGFIYSFKCFRSQSIYVTVKYGVSCPGFKRPPIFASQKLWNFHDIANTSYPHNYYLNSYVAREAINIAKNSVLDTNLQFDDFYLLARKALFYAKLAIDVNPYDEESRLMYQEALVLNGQINEAIQYWEGIVDLEYWNRSHHDVMAELYLKSNDISSAVRELPHVSKPDLRKKLLRYKKLLDKFNRNNNF